MNKTCEELNIVALDAFANGLEIGYEVIYIAPQRHFNIGVVKKITKQMVFIETKDSIRLGYEYAIKQYHHQVIVKKNITND